MRCIDTDAVCYEKSISYDHIEGTGTHQASEDETDAGDKLAQWQISFEMPSDLWAFVALLKLLLINNFDILYQNYGAKAISEIFYYPPRVHQDTLLQKNNKGMDSRKCNY